MSVWEKVNRNGRLESAPRGVRRQFGTRGKRGTVSTAKIGALSFKSLLVRMTSPRCRFPRAFAGFLHVELEISWKERTLHSSQETILRLQIQIIQNIEVDLSINKFDC